MYWRRSTSRASVRDSSTSTGTVWLRVAYSMSSLAASRDVAEAKAVPLSVMDLSNALAMATIRVALVRAIVGRGGRRVSAEKGCGSCEARRRGGAAARALRREV